MAEGERANVLVGSIDVVGGKRWHNNSQRRISSTRVKSYALFSAGRGLVRQSLSEHAGQEL
eukprot:3108880-Amphidinium_carterae.1